MRSLKNYALVFLALTTIAGAALAWRQYRELVSLRAAALSNGERADWQKRLWAAEKRRTELETQLETAQKETPHEDASSADVAQPSRPPRGDRGAGRAAFLAAMERPEIQRLIATQQKAGLDAHYAALFKSLALTPEQLDKFKNLLVEKRTAMMDVMAAAREEGINPRSDPAAFQKLVADAQSEIDTNIRSTLGDAAFSQYQNYEQTLPQRNLVNQLEQRLSYTSTPLTDAQSQQMVQILAANSPATRSGSTPTPLTALGNNLATAVGAGPSARITNTAVTQSLGVLAAPQVDALKQLQAEQRAQADLSAAMRAQFQGARNGGTATPAPTPAPRPGGG